jgi:dihydroneopterin aldolase
MSDQTIRIVLTNCSFYGYHGVLEAEKEMGQRFYVDVEFVVEKPGNIESDHINTTVHYGEVFEVVETTVTKQRYDLIETLAHFIGKNICNGFPKVKSAIVTVRKPSAPIVGVFDHVAVTVETQNG